MQLLPEVWDSKVTRDSEQCFMHTKIPEKLKKIFSKHPNLGPPRPYNTVQNPGSLSSPRPLAAAALPRKLLLVSLVSECVLHPPWLGLLVRIGVGWWWKSSAWWRGRGKAPP